jgi:microcystin-dependent protein
VPATVIRGRQIADGSVQRVDLDVTTVGQSVVTKLVQGSNVALSSTGADSGTGDVTISVPGGGAGANAFNITSGPFTVPPVGGTVVVSLDDASWVVVGQMVYVDSAGGGAGQAGVMQVTAKTGNQLTLLTPSPTSGIPLASVNTVGLLNVLSGLATDYVGGDNACHNVGLLMPTGTVLDFAGSTAPTGFVLCDGASYATTGAMAALFAVIGYTYGGSGANFNVPDARGRTSIGAGTGPGLTARTLAAKGGEETHALTTGELASHTHGHAHTHTMANHYHYCPGVDHLHSMQNHYHYCGGVDHYHAISYHQHTIPASANATPTGSTFVFNNYGAANWNPQSQVSAANTGAADRGLGFNSGGPSAGTTAAADRSLAFNSGGPSTNTSDGASTGTTDATGSGTGHNTMPPFVALNKIIKT